VLHFYLVDRFEIADTLHQVRNLLSLFNGIPDSQQTQIAVLNDNIEWAKREKRIFLKQSLETRLISL
jgi:26S proteasome regulatory subunit N6